MEFDLQLSTIESSRSFTVLCYHASFSALRQAQRDNTAHTPDPHGLLTEEDRQTTHYLTVRFVLPWCFCTGVKGMELCFRIQARETERKRHASVSRRCGGGGGVVCNRER